VANNLQKFGYRSWHWRHQSRYFVLPVYPPLADISESTIRTAEEWRRLDGEIFVCFDANIYSEFTFFGPFDSRGCGEALPDRVRNGRRDRGHLHVRAAQER
jgi:hypothetical protein